MAEPTECPSRFPKTIGVEDLKDRWVRRGFDERPLTYVVGGELPVYLLLERTGASVGDQMLTLSGLYQITATAVRSASAGIPCQARVITSGAEPCTNFTAAVVPAGTEVALIGWILSSAAGFLVRLDEVEQLEARFAHTPAEDQPATDRCVFRRDGKRWHYMFRGTSGSCRAVLGLAYIRELLSRPHQRLDAVELETAVSGRAAVEVPVRDRGEVIADEPMRRDLKQRFGDIASALDEARERADHPTIERLEDERDQLAREAKKLVGWHGRPRRMSDQVDKARKRVREAVTVAYRAIAEDHPELAEHLRTSIQLGTAPVYQPPPDAAVTWDA